MSVEELVAWAEEEARSPYLRSLPFKSRPFKNEMKGRDLFTDMYCAEDEDFEMYPPLNEDEVGKEDLLVWCFDLENEYINDVAKILEAMSEVVATISPILYMAGLRLPRISDVYDN
nr:pyruvate kinase [Tanacetum cinerariifolium]